MGKNLILCDSNIIIRHLRGDANAQANLREIGAKSVALSIITHAEIYYGEKKKNLNEIKLFLNSFHLFHIDEAVSKIFNGLIINYSSSRRIKIPDALIAATAISNHLMLYTDNRKDFDFIPEINFYAPSGHIE